MVEIAPPIAKFLFRKPGKSVDQRNTLRFKINLNLVKCLSFVRHRHLAALEHVQDNIFKNDIYGELSCVAEKIKALELLIATAYSPRLGALADLYNDIVKDLNFVRQSLFDISSAHNRLEEERLELVKTQFGIDFSVKDFVGLLRKQTFAPDRAKLILALAKDIEDYATGKSSGIAVIVHDLLSQVNSGKINDLVVLAETLANAKKEYEANINVQMNLGSELILIGEASLAEAARPEITEVAPTVPEAAPEIVDATPPQVEMPGKKEPDQTIRLTYDKTKFAGISEEKRASLVQMIEHVNEILKAVERFGLENDGNISALKIRKYGKGTKGEHNTLESLRDNIERFSTWVKGGSKYPPNLTLAITRFSERLMEDHRKFKNLLAVSSRPSEPKPAAQEIKKAPPEVEEAPELKIICNRNFSETYAKIIRPVIDEINQILAFIEQWGNQREGDIKELGVRIFARGTPGNHENIAELKRFLEEFNTRINSPKDYTQTSSLIRALNGFRATLDHAVKIQKEQQLKMVSTVLPEPVLLAEAVPEKVVVKATKVEAKLPEPVSEIIPEEVDKAVLAEEAPAEPVVVEVTPAGVAAAPEKIEELYVECQRELTNGARGKITKLSLDINAILELVEAWVQEEGEDLKDLMIINGEGKPIGEVQTLRKKIAEFNRRVADETACETEEDIIRAFRGLKKMLADAEKTLLEMPAGEEPAPAEISVTPAGVAPKRMGPPWRAFEKIRAGTEDNYDFRTWVETLNREQLEALEFILGFGRINSEIVGNSKFRGWIITLNENQLESLERIMSFSDKIWQRVSTTDLIMGKGDASGFINDILDASHILLEVNGFKELIERIAEVKQDGMLRYDEEIIGAVNEILLLSRLQSEAEFQKDRLTTVGKDLGSVEFYPEMVITKQGRDIFVATKRKDEITKGEIDADGHRGEEDILVEVKSCRREAGINFDIADGVKKEKLRLRNQARKYGAALRDNKIRGVEYHFVAKSIDAEVIDYLRDVIGRHGKLIIYRYDVWNGNRETILEHVPPANGNERSSGSRKNGENSNKTICQNWEWALGRYCGKNRSRVKTKNLATIFKGLRKPHSGDILSGLRGDLDLVVEKHSEDEEILTRVDVLRQKIKIFSRRLDTNSIARSAIKEFAEVLQELKSFFEEKLES